MVILPLLFKFCDFAVWVAVIKWKKNIEK